MADLTELLARVKAATGPDRELFSAIFLALLPEVFPTDAHQSTDWDFRQRIAGYFQAEAWTEAALALVERVLPGWIVRADIYADHATMGVEPPIAMEGGLLELAPAFHADAKAAPLALVLALLCALIAQPASKSVGSSQLTRDA